MAITKIPEGLKLNKFEMSVIPHARKLVSVYGFAASPASDYSGDDNAGVRPLSKLESIREGERYFIEMSKENNE